MLYALYGMRKAEYAQASENSGPTRGSKVRIHNFWNSHTHPHACYLSCSRYIQSSIIGVACGSTTHVPTTAANLCFSIIITLRVIYRNVGDNLTSTPEFSCTDFPIPSIFFAWSYIFLVLFESRNSRSGRSGGTKQALFPPSHYGMRLHLYRAKSAALSCTSNCSY